MPLLSLLLLALSLEKPAFPADPCVQPAALSPIKESEDMIRSVAKEVSKLVYNDEMRGRASDTSSFDCDQRKAYIQKKLHDSLTVRGLIQKIAKDPPKVLITGNDHAVKDESIWYDELEAAS